MAALAIATTERPHIADVKYQVFTITGTVNNGDTLTIPGGITRLLGVQTLSATGNNVGWAVSGLVATAIAAGAATLVKVVVWVA